MGLEFLSLFLVLFRSRRHSQHPPQSHQPVMPIESTVAMYTYLDEDLPYRSKLPSLQPTLRQFKEYLPKKGNFRCVLYTETLYPLDKYERMGETVNNFGAFFRRFFFRTTCEDPDSPIIQEEVVNDDEILPLFEGKVMGLVKPIE